MLTYLDCILFNYSIKQIMVKSSQSNITLFFKEKNVYVGHYSTFDFQTKFLKGY